MGERKIEAIIQGEYDRLYLLLRFPHKDVCLKYTFAEQDLDSIKTTLRDIEAVTSSVRENAPITRLCEELFDCVTYVPKDIQRRSGRLIIKLGDLWKYEITIELLADDIEDDLVHLCETLRTLASKMVELKTTLFLNSTACM